VVARYRAAGWWPELTLAQMVARHVAAKPNAVAFVDEHGRSMSWAQYWDRSSQWAARFIGAGLAPGAVVAVVLPDGPEVHAVFLGAERAGVIVMGIGHRAGDAEIAYLVGRSESAGLVTTSRRGDAPSDALFDRLRAEHPALRHRWYTDELDAVPDVEIDPRRALRETELFLLNSTSGTTGRPKCVMQTQARWFFFHRLAAEYGALSSADVFMSVVPAPFGFGLWTSHFTPTILGSPCAVMERFSAEGALAMIAREKVTVLGCVSTQFIMMLNSPALDHTDLSSLRVMFTGGEAIPYRRAVEFEERTGATVLNFYGSNETGLLSGTRLGDPPERRLTTGGRCAPEMQVRLYSEEGERLEGDVGRGIPACQGPATALGYWRDDAANAALVRPDGWMLMGDVVEIDTDGWLSVVGRTSDFIIRGGKNISAPAVEDEVMTHPAVDMVAVVAAPDPVFGERVAAVVECRSGQQLDLAALVAHLSERGVSREWFPEYLYVVSELPRASGGKVAKGAVKTWVAEQIGGAS
jgi:acyl-CoA synthetase